MGVEIISPQIFSYFPHYRLCEVLSVSDINTEVSIVEGLNDIEYRIADKIENSKVWRWASI